MHYPDVSQQITNALERSERVLAISHANPDADAVASLLAFRQSFATTERNVTMVLGGGTVPENLEFLIGIELIQRETSVRAEDFDLVVFLDCADEERVGPKGAQLLASVPPGVEVINIDHHVTNSRFGSINLVDSEAAATCEILPLLFEDLEIQLAADTATTIMAGIQGDTLGLRTPSTTGRTMDVSANLLRAGADLDTIVDYLFRVRPYSTLKLWAHALGATTFTGELIWTELTREMLEDSGADESEAEGIVNFLAGTREARAAAMLYRKHDGWRVSMRSRTDDVNVSELAGLFGGGGHARAAGCTLLGDISARESFLHTIAERISTASSAQLDGN
jgi:bifunctional oligoribonuclease and PAP phosphatase NrnA